MPERRPYTEGAAGVDNSTSRIAEASSTINVDLAQHGQLLQEQVVESFLSDVANVRSSPRGSVDRPRAEFPQADNQRAIVLRSRLGLLTSDGVDLERFGVESSWTCRLAYSHVDHMSTWEEAW